MIPFDLFCFVFVFVFWLRNERKKRKKREKKKKKWRNPREIERTYNTIRRGIAFDNLELNSSHSTSNLEQITLANRAVSFKEVWLQVSVKEISGESFDGVINGQNVNTSTIFNVWAWVNCHHISQANSQICTNNC